jgi:hypothetical protein
MDKSEKIVLRISAEDKAKIYKYAKASGMNPSEYLRRAGLRGTIFKTVEKPDSGQYDQFMNDKTGPSGGWQVRERKPKWPRKNIGDA